MVSLAAAANALQAMGGGQFARVMGANSPSQARRTLASPMMSDAKGRKKWEYRKGVNDAGIEQTYMTLSANDEARFAFDPFGFAEDETLALLWEKAYLIVLITPFLLALSSVILPKLGLILPSIDATPLEKGFELLDQGIGLVGTGSGQVMKLTFDIWNVVAPVVGLGGAVLKY